MDFVYILCCIILIIFDSAFILQTNGSATIYFKFINITVKSSGGHCSSLSQPDYCDIYFKLCITDPNLWEKFPTHRSECNIFDLRTPKSRMMNQDDFSFGDSIQYIPNPLSGIVESIPPKLNVKIEVWDADFSFSDLDDHLMTFEDKVYPLKVYPFDTAGSDREFSSLLSHDHHHQIFQNIQEGNITLYIAVWAVCSRNSYGSNCNYTCVPENRVRHYGCDISSGKKVCLPGWFGDECDKIDHCRIVTSCGPMGTCVNSPSGYECICNHNFTGADCSEPPSQCITHQEYCQNGFCLLKYVDDDNRMLPDPIPYCACIPGFTGKWCELDIDECSRPEEVITSNNSNNNDNNSTEVSPMCNPNSVCENIYGNFHCFCQNGWTGLHCNTPPTLWPDDYQPVLSSKGLPSYPPLKRVNFTSISKKRDHETMMIDKSNSTTATTTNNNWIIILLGLLFSLCIVFCTITYFICRQRKHIFGAYNIRWNRKPVTPQVFFNRKSGHSNVNIRTTISCRQSTPPPPPLPPQTPHRSPNTKLHFTLTRSNPLQTEKCQSTIYDEIPECFLQDQSHLTTKPNTSFYDPYSQLEYDILDTTIGMKSSNDQDRGDYSNNTTDANGNNDAQGIQNKTFCQDQPSTSLLPENFFQEADVFTTKCIYLEPRRNIRI
uniref:Delta-like protein n=1 Tax=Trichobilharzia regenti TaxID=157069 RepID=A0AA85IKS3_TRIRE|nr:unnamed protein product [Trichobilharzia regenti]